MVPIAVLAVVVALGAACSGEDADDGGADGSVPIVTTSADAPGPAADPGIEDCPIVPIADIVRVLDLPDTTLLLADDTACLFTVDGDVPTLGSLSIDDEAYGRGLMDQFESYDADELRMFDLERLEDVDGVEGAFRQGGFTILVGGRTYQFTLDGPAGERSMGVLPLVRYLADRAG